MTVQIGQTAPNSEVERSEAATAGAGEPGWLTGVPDGRDLERQELRHLVSTIAHEPETWSHLVRVDGSDRYFVQLHRDPHLDVWLICWTGGQETGFHDHDLSSGAVHVCEGQLVEERLELRDGAFLRASVGRGRGTTFDFDASHVHSLRHAGGPELAVSIHVYSPALWRMGYYEVGSDSVLRRLSVSYAEELKLGVDSAVGGELLVA
jgi:predicted metal-dependent enzyme (double-stranded beta helix superfamily)